jgi:hypothetical protein
MTAAAARLWALYVPRRAELKEIIRSPSGTGAQRRRNASCARVLNHNVRPSTLSRARRTLRKIFPVGDFGMASMNSTCRIFL